MQPTVLLVHGGPGMDSSYLAAFAQRAGQFAQVRTYNQHPLAGEDPTAFTMGDLVNQLREHIQAGVQQADGQPLTVLAHSWGTHVALHTLRQHPELAVARLTLWNAVPLTWSAFHEAAARQLPRICAADLARIEELEASGTEADGLEVMRLAADSYLAPAHAGLDVGVRRYNPTACATIASTAQGYDLTDVMFPATLQVSTVWGEYDHFQPSDWPPAQLTRTRSYTLPNCGHFPFAEVPDQALALLREILEQG